MPKPNNHDIKDLRRQSKMTLREMSAYLGVTIMTINRWERGESKPSQLAVRQLNRLRKKLETKP